MAVGIVLDITGRNKGKKEGKCSYVLIPTLADFCCCV
jgi:hypothetical protein